MAAPQFSVSTAIVKGGLFETAGLTSLASLGYTPARRATLQSMGGLGGYANITDRVLIQALIGAVPGGAAVSARRWVAPTEELGGLRPIETYTFLNRNTTSADQTEYKNEWHAPMYQRTWKAAPNVIPNLDRNPLGTR